MNRRGPTAQQLADFFGLSRVTINTYKNGTMYQRRRYHAMRKFYEEATGVHEERAATVAQTETQG